MNESTHEHHVHHHHEHAHGNHSYTHPWAFLKDLENLGDEYLVRKAPWQLPQKWREFVAKFLPIIALIVAVVTIPGIIGLLFLLLGIGGSAMHRGIGSYRGTAYPIVFIQAILTIAMAILYFKAFQPLKKRHYIGWVFVFYAGLLSLLSNLLEGGIIGALIGFIISMFLLFQSKDQYHG